MRNAHGTRAAVSHMESNHHFWAWGETAEARLAAAHQEIDIIYERRWQLMQELIEEGDFHGPNVWVR